MQQKILRSIDVPQFKETKFCGTLFQTLSVVEYGGDIIKQSVLTYADDLFGLYVQTPSVKVDLTPSRLDGQRDLRYRPTVCAKSGTERLSDFLATLTAVEAHGNLIAKGIPSSSKTSVGMWNRGEGPEQAAFLLDHPSSPIYFYDNFHLVHDALEVLSAI